jgi:hypothetical protein
VILSKENVLDHTLMVISAGEFFMQEIYRFCFKVTPSSVENYFKVVAKSYCIVSAENIQYSNLLLLLWEKNKKPRMR